MTLCCQGFPACRRTACSAAFSLHSCKETIRYSRFRGWHGSPNDPPPHAAMHSSLLTISNRSAALLKGRDFQPSDMRAEITSRRTRSRSSMKNWQSASAPTARRLGPVQLESRPVLGPRLSALSPRHNLRTSLKSRKATFIFLLYYSASTLGSSHVPDPRSP